MRDKSVNGVQMNRRQVMLSGAAVAAMAAAPAAAQDQPRLIIDAIGLHVHLPRPAERVVIASHYSYEDFTAIAGVEGWSRVVGIAREPWDHWRAADYAQYAKVIPILASVPDVGILGNRVDVDKVIALKPDVVLMEAFGDRHVGIDVGALRAADIPVVRLNFQTQRLSDYIASTVAIGLVMGTEKRAGALIDLYERLYLDVMSRAVQSDLFTKSAYIELAESGPETIGFTDSQRLWGLTAIELGVNNIADGKVPDHGGQLPTEALLAADPDFIFFAGASWPDHSKGLRLGYGVDAATTRAGLLSYAARPGYDRLKAVKAGAVHAIPHNLAWSLRDVYAMQYMAKQMHPDLFADIDPVKGLADFHARFLPVPFSGTWFASLVG
jgi:iron complex transport system substrate-binding protein